MKTCGTNEVKFIIVVKNPNIDQRNKNLGESWAYHTEILSALGEHRAPVMSRVYIIPVFIGFD